MSVESEILRIQRNVADTYATVAEKGGTVPLQPNSENLPAAVSSIPAGGNGGGGSPIGTIISFMGTSAPQGYLVCDGAEYEITFYPDLADHFLQQFGSANHFGGDGTTTFAVPDMRNLFLRGYHGAAEEKLSGEIGAKQSGTQHPTVFQAFAGDFQAAVAVINDKKETVPPENVDDYQEKNDSWGRMGFAANNFAAYGGQNVVGGKSFGKRYTARPANMAVLYCIKAK